MKADFATINIALQECLLPSELNGLLKQAEQRKVKPGEVIVLAVRDYLAKANAAEPQPEAKAS